MAREKKHTAEQLVRLLRQIEVGLANGKTAPIACRETGAHDTCIGPITRYTCSWHISPHRQPPAAAHSATR
jgi:hypothetical protein